ncbi:hypothetical protein D3C71_1827910 [compost metagenome]
MGNVLVQQKTLLGRRDARAVAAEKCVADLLLQLLHQAADGGLRAAQQAPCGSHAASGDHGRKSLELTEFHRVECKN